VTRLPYQDAASRVTPARCVALRIPGVPARANNTVPRRRRVHPEPVMLTRHARRFWLAVAALLAASLVFAGYYWR
jgi:hypothetical protein